MKNYDWGQLLASAVKSSALLRQLSCWLLAMGLVFAHASNAYAWYDRTAIQPGSGGWIYGGAYAGSGQGNAFGRAGSTLPPTPLNGYDDGYMNIRFPTSWNGGRGFPYYGEFYQWMQVHTNGFIVLKKTLAEKPAAEAWDTPIHGSDFSPKRITRVGGGPNVPAGIIAPWWSDWDPSSTTALIMAERNCWWFGTCTNSANDAQPFIVEWRDIYHYGGNSRYSFGIRLYPVSGKIEFQYGNVIGADQWSGGNLSSAGYQRDSNTVGDEVFFNGVLGNQPGWGTSLQSNTVIQYTPPQTATIYTHTRDFVAGGHRAGIALDQGFTCSDWTGGIHHAGVTTSVSTLGDNVFGGVARLSTPTAGCGSGGDWNYHNGFTQIVSKIDAYQNDLTWPAGSTHYVVASNLRAFAPTGTGFWGGLTAVGGGPFTFLTYDNLTPAPRTTGWFPINYTQNRQSALDPSGINGIYGASCWPQHGQGSVMNSRLVWYGKPTSSYAKTLILVPGMDPLNTSNPAVYLTAFYPVLKRLIHEGYLIAIGDFGAPSVSPRCLIDELALWIDLASSYGGNKVSVAGLSMGGVVIRNLVDYAESWRAPYYANVKDKIRAWFSLDSPHQGANIGGSFTSETDNVCGMQTLIACEAQGSENWNTIISENARAMMYHSWASRSCSGIRPDWHRTAMSPWWHDNYYSSFGTPGLTIPRYAIAQGDGLAARDSWGILTNPWTSNGSGTLFHFDVGFLNGDWDSHTFDRFAGSTYISGPDVNQETWYGELHLNWKPSFMNVHSALNASFTDSTNDGVYDDVTPGSWTGTAVNDSNWPHCWLSDANACALRNWVRKEQGEALIEGCQRPPASVPPDVQAIQCSLMLKGG